MKRMSRICCTLALLLASLSAVPAADAANLKARSATINPATGYPTWYQDNNNLALSLCLDQNGFCLLPGAFTFPANKADITAGNFPVEAFYYMADTAGDSPGGTISLTLWEAALESGFAATVVDGGQAVFTRIRIRANVTLPGTYTVTHPYGVDTFVVAAADIGPAHEINFSEDVPGLVAGLFDLSLTSRVGPFLTRADGTFVTDPVSGNRYIGVPGAQVAVTGSPTGVNSVTITGPTADTLTLNTFSLMGKVIGLDVAPKTNLDLGAANIVTPAAPPQTVTVTNTTGSSITMAADLNAAGIKAGADALDFIVTAPAAIGAVNCAGATLTAAAPGNSCTFDVTFTPAAVAKAARAATILLAPLTVQPAPPPAAQLSDPPPVTLNLSGTAQVLVTATSAGHGLITPNTIAVGAGTTVDLTVTPENKKFKVKEVADGAALLGTPPGTPPFTFNAGAVNHTVTATFMPSGDLNANGALDIPDVIKALKIMAGIQAADTDDPDNTAVDVAPLAAGKPAPDARIDIGDVLVILRRVIGLDTW